MNGITFNGKHSYKDFGLILEEKKINPPAKTKITETVPYMNSLYDFSTVGTNGEQVYSNRTITIKLALLCYARDELYTLYSQILSWLMDTGQQKLEFDFMPDYYFLAEAQNSPSWDEFRVDGEMTIEFVCEPFRTAYDYMGEDIWDDFNFLSDYTQYTNIFNVTGTADIVMNNNGRNITPIINCSSAMTAIFNNVTYNLVQGDNKPYGMKLQNGSNDITFSGTGTVTITFYPEVI